jgi:hypothetical protein
VYLYVRVYVCVWGLDGGVVMNVLWALEGVDAGQLRRNRRHRAPHALLEKQSTLLSVSPLIPVSFLFFIDNKRIYCAVCLYVCVCSCVYVCVCVV